MADKALDRKAMLQRILEKSNSKKGNSQRDPFEWKPPQAGKNEKLKIRCLFLSPLNKGDKCQTGIAKMGMDDVYFVRGGFHWIDKRPYPCPRAFDDKPCPYCQLGFDLLGETEDKDARREISSTYIAKTTWTVNVYFPIAQDVPKDLQDKVFYWQLQKTIFDMCDACLNNENAGTEDDPQPHGFFFDPTPFDPQPDFGYYPFILTMKQKGDYNDYTESKFLPKLVPLAVDKTGKPDKKKIEEILARRHDIAAKFPVRDDANLKFLTEQANKVRRGDDSSGGDGFDATEGSAPAEDAPAPKAALTVKKPTLAPTKPAAPAAKVAPAKPVTPAKAPAPAAAKPAAKPAAPAAKPAAPAAKAPVKPAAKPAPKAEEPPAEETPTEETPADDQQEVAEAAETETVAEETPAEGTPAEETAATEETPAEETPAEETPAEEAAATEEAPAEDHDNELKKLLGKIKAGKV
jgi:hypothetical protein